MANKRFTKSRFGNGSALILTVVLTSLLAIVGVLFVLVSRLNKIETSAISENRELKLAVDTVIAKVSQELVLDVPGVAGQKYYYDYPDANNAWLANLEPNDNRIWQHISDIYGVLDVNAWNLQADIVPDYQNPGIMGSQLIADADGDGVADSRWVIIPDMTSSKGKPIFAAVRIIDNGGMLNVNTAYKFDPCEPVWRIDGSSQMQINLMALSWRLGRTTYDANDETDLLEARANPGFGLDPNNLNAYERDVVWHYGEPNGPYTPFDISDELELRYRFLVNQEDIDTRLEVLGLEHRRDWELRTINDFRTPAGQGDLGEWFKSAYDNGSLDPNYAYRHIATTYNMDRILNPLGSGFNNGKMVNVNRIDGNDVNAVERLYSAIYAGLSDANFAGNLAEVAAQVAVNLIDFRDDDNDVTSYRNPSDGKTYYGFERPCIYISELAHNFVLPSGPTDSNHHSYAIEFYKPYSEDSVSPSKWQLKFPTLGAVSINWRDPNQFHVAVWEDPLAPLDVNSTASSQKVYLAGGVVILNSGDLVELQREVTEPNGTSKYITVDSILVPAWLADPNVSLQRDMSKHKCIRRLWDTSAKAPTLGSDNSYKNGDSILIQAHPYLDPLIYENQGFKNIGEIGMVFVKSAYSQGPNPIGPNDTETTARLNLADPNYQQIFNYLTVFDPAAYSWNDPNETRVKGRININTAPWYVIAQLPWVSQRINQLNYLFAQWIVVYRETVGGFRSIGELNNVVVKDDPNHPSPIYRLMSIDYYSRDSTDLATYPDLTWSDGAIDDFEERDVIFSRISNLVTVRSDVFTAYILVRIGTDGPQKRMVAILDRSNVYSPRDKVRIVALHPVPDPR